MREMIKSVAKSTPGIGELIRQRDQAFDSLIRLKGEFQYAPGHFYSTIPSQEEIGWRFSASGSGLEDAYSGIELNERGQKEFCREILEYYSELPFGDEAEGALRYFYDNPAFLWADAIFLYSVMRHFQPRRIVEIGSGYSSAVMLDTAERFIAHPVEMTFIEPYPERLIGLIREEDTTRCQIVERRIQDVEDAPWQHLDSGDVLFIDSSHVSKCGSDVNRIFFEVIPSLKPGVLVHVHDIFPGFEYPKAWLDRGVFWNETYLLRSFLQFNSSFEVLLWGPYLIEQDRKFFEASMPLCLKNSGGSFWMRRR